MLDSNHDPLKVGQRFNKLTLQWPDKGSKPVIPEIEIFYQETIYMKSHLNATDKWDMFAPAQKAGCDLEPIRGIQMNNRLGDNIELEILDLLHWL